jgi:murein L,D-transpeptidase YcbB/YkuD
MFSVLTKGMLRPILFVLAAALLAPLPQSAAAQGFADSAQLRDQIRKRADRDLRPFYAARDNAPLWLDAAGRPSGAAALLLYRLRTAQFDGLDPDDFRPDKVARLVDRARGGDEDDQARAEAALSEAFADYVRGTRGAARLPMIYENEALEPVVPSARSALEEAARAGSLEHYLDEMRWMHPLYAPLRKAMEHPRFSPGERQQIWTNLARLRAIPSLQHGRHVLVDLAGARLWMYEDGRAVDSMKVVVGKPELPTPVMAGWIRHAVHNPYWNVPDDLVKNTIAANVLDHGLGYLRDRGYQVLAGWSPDAPPLDPKSVDWLAVNKGLRNVHVRQLPGGDNFMGRVKFEFPNPQGIYLHDTPDLHLMREEARQLSSGCVRLEDAARMHRWLMGAPLPASSRKGQPEKIALLPEPVPIYITYLTVQPAGESLAFLGDPYALDARVQIAAR